jgi:hypothetical protein
VPGERVVPLPRGILRLREPALRRRAAPGCEHHPGVALQRAGTELSVRDRRLRRLHASRHEVQLRLLLQPDHRVHRLRLVGKRRPLLPTVDCGHPLATIGIEITPAERAELRG